MSRSIQEEIIAVLWIIAALLAFQNGHNIWGWIFTIKGALDTCSSTCFAIMEVIDKKRAI
ncbi:MAG: hypothetical protein MUO63_01915 [Desulfobulbaceae bacterium]|nr:hypothetical protein [Desulfobulbaceae bacterium]